jgi:hypothetical protein
LKLTFFFFFYTWLTKGLILSFSQFKIYFLKIKEKDDDEKEKENEELYHVYTTAQVHFEHIVIICQLEIQNEFHVNLIDWSSYKIIRISKMNISYTGERVTISNDVLIFFFFLLSHLFFVFFIVIVWLILLIQ